jgi:hypothetical protein
MKKKHDMSKIKYHDQWSIDCNKVPVVSARLTINVISGIGTKSFTIKSECEEGIWTRSLEKSTKSLMIKSEHEQGIWTISLLQCKRHLWSKVNLNKDWQTLVSS